LLAVVVQPPAAGELAGRPKRRSPSTQFGLPQVAGSRTATQRPHPHAIGLDDTELAAQADLLLGRQELLHPSKKRLGRRWIAKKHDATRGWKAPVKGEFTEVFVASQDDAGFPLSRLEHRGVGLARHAGPCPEYVMPGLLQPPHGDAREILIREKVHAYLLSFRGGEGDNTLRLQDLGSVEEARRNVVVCQARVVLDDLLLRPTGSHQFDDLLNGQPSALDDRLPSENAGIKPNAFLPAHHDDTWE